MLLQRKDGKNSITLSLDAQVDEYQLKIINSMLDVIEQATKLEGPKVAILGTFIEDALERTNIVLNELEL